MNDDRKRQLNEEIARLVRKLKEGDSHCFERLYELSLPRLTPYAYTLMKKEEEAQDLLQDTYIRILQQIGSLRDDERFLAWARTIMHNIAMRGFRRSSREQVVRDDDDMDLFEKIAENSDEFLPGLDLEKMEVQDAVFEMIRELPVKQRVTLLAFYYDSMKIREIADMMDCQEGTVKSQLHKARTAMKQMVLAYEKKNGVKLRSITPFIGPAIERYAESKSVPSADRDAMLSRLMDHASGAGVGTGDGPGSGTGSAAEPLHSARRTMRRAAKPIAVGLAAVVAAGGMMAAHDAHRDAQNAVGMRTAVIEQLAEAMTDGAENILFSKAGIAKFSSDIAGNTGFARIDLNDDSHDELLMKTEYTYDDSFGVLIVDGEKSRPEPNAYRIQRDKADAIDMFYISGKNVGRIYVSRDRGGKKSYTAERLFADATTSSYTEDITARQFREAAGSSKAVKIDMAGFKSFSSGEEMSRYTDKQFGFTVDERAVVIAVLFMNRLQTRWQNDSEDGDMTGTAFDILGLVMDLDAKDIKDAADCNGDMTAEISAGTLTLEYQSYCTLTAELDDGKLKPDTLVKLSFVP